MADFERKLIRLAERGTHVGPEEMIERVSAILAEQPVVVANKQRKGRGMSGQSDDSKLEEGNRRRGWVWAMAAFVAVLALGVLYLALKGQGSSEPVVPAPTTTIPAVETTVADASPTTISAEETLAARVTIIKAMIEARNSGDYDAWRAFFPAEGPNIFGGVVTDESELDWQRSYMAANEVWRLTGPCQLEATGVGCPMTLVNEFLGPGGIFYTVPKMDFYFTANEEMTGLGANAWDIAGDPAVYEDAFDAWLAEAYPEVHASFGPRIEGEGALPNAEDMPTAIRYVDEFLAQSDVYPLGG